MSMVGFPLLLIPLAICNIIVFLMPSVSFSTALFTLPLLSGVGWTVTLSDVLLALGVLMLLFEVIEGRAPGRQIFHRSSAVADRVRRRRSRIRAAAAVRHLDLFPADAAGAGGFPVRRRAAAPAPPRRRGPGDRRGRRAMRHREPRRRPAPLPRRPTRCRTGTRAEPDAAPCRRRPSSRRRKSSRPAFSPAAARSRRRTIRRTDRKRVRRSAASGGPRRSPRPRSGWRRTGKPPHIRRCAARRRIAGLRGLLRRRDQMGHERGSGRFCAGARRGGLDRRCQRRPAPCRGLCHRMSPARRIIGAAC